MDYRNLEQNWADIGQELIRLGLTAHVDRWFVRLFDCNLVPATLSVETAHRRLQIHAHYPGSPCRQRRAALQVLVDSGEYVLSSQFG